MARQAIRQASDLFFGLFQVAIQAPTHVHLHHRPGNRHVTHVAMASLAVEACPQVGLMAEIDEVGLPVYAVPRDWLVSFPVARQSLNSFVVGGDEGVAAHTFLHGGYTGYI